MHPSGTQAGSDGRAPPAEQGDNLLRVALEVSAIRTNDGTDPNVGFAARRAVGFPPSRARQVPKEEVAAAAGDPVPRVRIIHRIGSCRCGVGVKAFTIEILTPLK